MTSLQGERLALRRKRIYAAKPQIIPRQNGRSGIFKKRPKGWLRK
jgi:hypothetical protein